MIAVSFGLWCAFTSFGGGLLTGAYALPMAAAQQPNDADSSTGKRSCFISVCSIFLRRKNGCDFHNKRQFFLEGSQH